MAPRCMSKWTATRPSRRCCCGRRAAARCGSGIGLTHRFRVVRIGVAWTTSASMVFCAVDGDEAKPALLLWPPGRCTVRVLECVGHNGILEHPELALDTFLEFHDTLGT